MLADWQDAPCVVLSCPGPLRRHAAAVQAADGVMLPQVLLGSESQLLAVVALALREGAAGRLVFTPFPEMFARAASLASALGQAELPSGAGMVHLRFGGVRSARVLKGVRNAAVLAECGGAALLTASHHPFASGMVLPAAMQRVYRAGAGVLRPMVQGGGALPCLDLPAGLLEAVPAAADGGEAEGLEVTSLAGFQSDAWAAGPMRGASACAADGTPTVLVPWNMDHPGSIVPELLCRFARLYAPGDALPRIVLLPFNYIGQTGIIRDTIAQIRMATEPEGALLPRLFLGRVRTMAGVAGLRRLSRTAWVDGNDPEHWWTLGRLAACGIAAVLVGGQAAAGALHVLADEKLRVEAETRCGALIFQALVPARRVLPHLLEITAAQQALAPADAAPLAAARPRGPKRRHAGVAI